MTKKVYFSTLYLEIKTFKYMKKEIVLPKEKKKDDNKKISNEEKLRMLNRKQYSNKPTIDLYEAYGVKNGKRINYSVLEFDNEIRIFHG